MKTKKLSVLLLSILFLGSNLISSCSNEATQNNESISNTTLLKNLKNFNQSTEFTNLKCDGFWNCLGDVLVVAGADIISGVTAGVGVQQLATSAGAVTSGTGWVIVTGAATVIGGAGGSIAAARTIDDKEEAPETKSVDTEITLPTKFSGFLNVGIEHNIVISNTFKGYDISEYYKYKGLSKEHIAILESSEMQKIYSDIEALSINYVNNDFNYDSFTKNCVELGIMNNNIKDVLDLFLEKYITCSSYSDIETTVQFYIDEVNKSSLKYEEKSALMGGFMIATQSPAQWLR